MKNLPSPIYEAFMREALIEAENALKRGDRPIGAVITHGEKIISRSSNMFKTSKSDVAHAELNAILSCTSYLQQFGPETAIFTTCEPCPMCLGAIIMANIRDIVFGMPDNYTQGRLSIDAVPYIKKRINRYVGGVLQDDCVALFRRFSDDEANLCLKGVKN